MGVLLLTLLSGFPFLRLPVPTNLAPKVLAYEDSRQIMQTFVDDLAKAESTLAAINDPQVKLPLHVTQIKLDFVGNGCTSSAQQARTGSVHCTGIPVTF